jgi:formiminotetrahydrofolate cyclodeaminase
MATPTIDGMSQTNDGSTFRDLTLGAFVDRLASAEPVPGGGSASAVGAALGAALVTMVASLSSGKPKYAEHEALHQAARTTGRRLATRFLDLADEDAVAYAAYAAALKLPKDTEAEQSTRRAAMRAAARRASEVPLETVEACLELIAAVEPLVGRSNPNAASDLDVAALLADAAARGAGANVLINLPAVGDTEWADETTARVVQLLDNVEELADAVHALVRGGETRERLQA